MRINEIKCKTALSKSTLPGLDYSLNPYRGCQHNCAYCYVPNVLRIERKEWGSFVYVKTNIPVVLSKELKRKKPGVVGISTVTDPYQPLEKKYKLTRYCLEQLLKYDFPVCIQTKSNLITRDIDLISKFFDAEILISIGTLNDSERKMLEPGSSSINDRLDVLKNFSDIGVKTGIFFGPVYPTVKKEDIPKIIEIFMKSGVKEIMVDKFNLKPGIADRLKKSFPNHIGLILDQTRFNSLFQEIKELGEQRGLRVISAF